MIGEADLRGHRILVVEDDYFLATDTARALQRAGADILGPCPSEEAARAEMEQATPTAAVVDINLGDGPSFGLARILRARGTPFVFITGYDDEAIPAEFEGVARLQKPADYQQIVGSLARILGATPRVG
ncbi:hypothetical protein MMB17_00425 [Methylobacterium organophilum]|uniref:hypothetical protein n=1 Tax=Methylobacterium organophilum TaxID=410 RepID=UPI001F13580E|nr:hypothetical protein [Methylobacterium organophilum]UMY17867.1 hypothetical protein MMB17_00425 [Methylobacterium organophilum]